jgi:hypothetical protein
VVTHKFINSHNRSKYKDLNAEQLAVGGLGNSDDFVYADATQTRWTKQL